MSRQDGAHRPKSEPSKSGRDFQLMIRWGDNALRKDGARFLCNVRFKNDLPEIPCDPKMLLPPLNPAELGAFKLTSLEKEMKRDMIFPADLGIPINALDIERYNAPNEPPPMDPEDASLVEEGELPVRGGNSLGGAAKPGMRQPHSRARREGAADVSWLMRTKYITNDFAGGGRRGSGAGAAKAAKARADSSPGEAALAAQIETIEASFEAAKLPPVHPKNLAATPLEVLPILPDQLLEGWSCVVATFDGNPTADVERVAKMPEEERARAVQAMQLKSFVRRRDSGAVDRFVALMVPSVPPPVVQIGDGAVAMPAASLCGDYEWVREYDSQVRYDERGQTYLFRVAEDHVGYADLNTKVGLRKRKRGVQAAAAEEADAFVQPEKFVLEIAKEEGGGGGGAVEGEQVQGEQMPVATGAAAELPSAAEAEGGDVEMDDAEGEAAAVGVKEAQQQQQQEAEAAVDVDATAKMMRNVFGSDSDDD